MLYAVHSTVRDDDAVKGDWTIDQSIPTWKVFSVGSIQLIKTEEEITIAAVGKRSAQVIGFVIEIVLRCNMKRHNCKWSCDNSGRADVMQFKFLRLKNHDALFLLP